MIIKKIIVGVLALLQLSDISAALENDNDVNMYYVEGIEIQTSCKDIDCSFEVLESFNKLQFENGNAFEVDTNISGVNHLPRILAIPGHIIKLQMVPNESTLLLCKDVDGTVLSEGCNEPVESSWTYWLNIDVSESGLLSINPKNIPLTCASSRYETCEDIVVRKDSVELGEFWIAGHYVLEDRNIITLFKVGLVS